MESDYNDYIEWLKSKNKPLPVQATDLLHDGSKLQFKRVNKYRIEIYRLADNDINTFKRLYEETPIIEVYELLTLKLSSNYQRPSFD